MTPIRRNRVIFNELLAAWPTCHEGPVGPGEANLLLEHLSLLLTPATVDKSWITVGIRVENFRPITTRIHTWIL